MTTSLVYVSNGSAHVVSVGYQGPPGPPGDSVVGGGVSAIEFNKDGSLTVEYINGETHTAAFRGVIDGGEF